MMKCDRCGTEINIMDIICGGPASKFDLNGDKFSLCPDCVSGMIYVMKAYATNKITLDNIVLTEEQGQS